MKIWFLLLVPVALLSCANRSDNKPLSDVDRLHFKNWTLSRCLSEIATDPALKQDALNTASSYLESSSLPIEAFSSADELVNPLPNRNLRKCMLKLTLGLTNNKRYFLRAFDQAEVFA